MRELTIDEVDEVSGGVTALAVFAGIAAVGAYLALLDQAAQFGSALGAGLYDGINC